MHSSLESGEIPPSQPAEDTIMSSDNPEPALIVSPEPLDPPKEEPFEYILPRDLVSIDQISNKFKNGYYHSIDRLLADL